MSRAEEVDALLEEIYSRVPQVGCKGLCTDACGPVTGGHRELVRMARAGVKLPPHREAVRIMNTTPGDYECPALKNGQCSVYEVRPAICRVWGATEDLPCPYGCQPAGGRLLTTAEAQVILDEARKAGTLERTYTVQDIERLLEQPGARDFYRGHVPRPVATRNLDGTLKESP